MKKILMFLLATATLLTACTTKPEDVALKINEGKELTQTDYNVMLEYAVNTMRQLNDTINAYSNDRKGLFVAIRNMDTQPVMGQIFLAELAELDTVVLDEQNRALYEKFVLLHANNAQKMAEITGLPQNRLDGSQVTRRPERTTEVAEPGGETVNDSSAKSVQTKVLHANQPLPGE